MEHGLGVFTYRHVVRFPDVDHAGIAFYGALQVYCHYAHEEWLKMLGFPLHSLIEEQDTGFPLVRLHTEFASPARHGDIVRIDVTLNRLGARSLALDYALHNETSQKAMGQTQIVQVCVRMSTMTSQPIPDAFRAAVESWSPASTPAEGCPDGDV